MSDTLTVYRFSFPTHGFDDLVDEDPDAGLEMIRLMDVGDRISVAVEEWSREAYEDLEEWNP